MNIIISPFSQIMRNGKENPKNYPYWQQIIMMLHLKGHRISQLGRGQEKKFSYVDDYLFDLKLPDVKKVVSQHDIFMSVDNFLPHMVHHDRIKIPGIVIWGKSDPKIYGYPENENILKDRARLRPDQFNLWEQATFDSDDFLKPAELLARIKSVSF